MIIAREAHDDVARWVADHIPGCERGFGNCKTISVIDRDQIIAGIVYHNWSPEAGVIELSGASTTPRWLTKPVLWAMFSYPFNFLGLQMVIMRVAPSNTSLRGILKNYGFKEFVIPRLRGRNEAEVICTLTDDAWRSNGFHKEHKKDLASG